MVSKKLNILIIAIALSLLAAPAHALISLERAINKAQARYAGSEAYSAERFRLPGGAIRITVKLLQSDRIVEVTYNAVNGRFLFEDFSSSSSNVQRVKGALTKAVLDLKQSIGIARGVFGSGQALEAALRLASDPSRNGTLYLVLVRTPSGNFEVRVDSISGAVIKVDDNPQAAGNNALGPAPAPGVDDNPKPDDNPT